MQMIDAHIHLDQYKDEEIKEILEESSFLEGLISVSSDLDSCRRNLQLARKYKKVKAAFGFHPEQGLPSPIYLEKLLDWINQNHAEMIAVGEVGLPYYLKQEKKVNAQQNLEYLDLLEEFIKTAKRLEKPIILHAVYEDAPIVCGLLEKYSLTKAHFHWFKGDKKTISRMMGNGFFISITPDIYYEEEIQKLVESYPLKQIMVETDGPWPFEGPFKGKSTHPAMMEETIKIIARLKGESVEETAQTILDNTKAFYQLK